MLVRRLGSDPRHYQIASLALLLFYGLWRLDLEVRPASALAALGTALLTQWACTRWWRLPAFDPRSALISGLSLCLLLRTEWPVLAALAGLVSIAAKFVLRIGGKHLFNPTNLGIVALLAVGAPVWVSPGQWGSTAFLGFLVLCLGGLVVTRAARADVTLSFIAFHAAIQFGRSLWLGEPLAIPLHRMENGALLIFSFFMISDPKTTPDSRLGRVLFSLLVALGAAWVQYGWFRTNGLLWSLAAFSLLVPLIDRLLPGARYQWRATPGNAHQGVRHEMPAVVPVARA
jgi:Na+-transporting NADH:ubiquinone oxidoreductase subunit NqrB